MLVEGLLEVERVRAVPVHFYDGQNKLLRLIQRGQNLILCDGHAKCAFGPPFDLDKAECGPIRIPQLGGDFGLNVIPLIAYP